ncbi:eCIS core domain-containing protein [Deinococcus ficus]|uniref:eCIS core domain-containing protein n=1 Tax=Deinococcus ficus TaxID=317577 RepID=UPI0003B366FC|nr:DUF4157 domain-containing protein [Deinococcus ficus]
MQHAPKPGTVRVNPTSKHQPAVTPAPRVALPAPPARSLTQGLQRLVSTPTQAQRQAAAPVLRAAQLDRQERQALAAAVQRVHAAAHPVPTSPSTPSPMPVPAAPGSPAALIQRLATRAAQAEGRHLNPRQHAEYTALQRQVAETLGQGYRQDRRPGAERNEAYGELIGQLHHHSLTSHVGRSVLGLVPASDRPALQRAVDLHVQRHQDAQAAAQQAQAQVAVQRQLAELNEQATRPVLQRIQERRGTGNPLPEAVRRHLEQGLNHDLSRVRIHDDAEADKLAKGVNAVAFTTGTDIYFRSGKFNPNTQSGLELLAHEVTHTVQQAQGKVGKGVDPDAGLESEARSMGAKLAQVMPSPKGLLPPVPHRDGPHAPGVYSQKAALQRVQDGAARHVSLKPLYDLYPHAMQRSPDLTLQRDWGILGDAANWVGDKVQDGAAALAAKGKELITKGLTVLPGYRELCLAFGKDLVTGNAVSGSAESILTTLTNWVPGPLKDILRALKETNVIGKAWDWFKAELGKLNLGGALGEIADAIKSADLGKAKAAVTTRISGVKNLILGSAQKIAEIGLTALTAALGPLGKKIMAGLKGAQGNIIKILKDPVAFAKNLIAAVKGGFTQFTGNAPKHLQNGVGQWLTGSTGIQFPARFDLQGVFLTALTVMGLTYQNMRGKLVHAMGPGGADKVQKAEQTVSALQTMKTGLHKAEEMKGEQGSTGKAIQDGIKSEVTKSLVMAGVQKLVTMLVPGGGFINAIIGAFQTVQTIVQQAAQIGAVITSALSGVSAIIAGNVTAAAGFIDRSLGGSIPVALAWLSKIIGLGNFGGKVKAVIQRVRGKLDGVVNKIVTKVKGIIDKLFGKGKPGQKGTESRTLAQKQADVGKAKLEAESAADKHWNNRAAFQASLAAIKSKYALKTIRYDALDDFTGTVFVEINPSATTKKLHTMFYPVNPEFTLDPKGIRIKYSTRSGKNFETIIGRSGHLKSTAGFDLNLTPPGRGTTQNPRNKVSNSGQNSTHIIADWFGGSGYRKSLNIVTASDHFNKQVMGAAERNIVAWVGSHQIATFNLHVLVDWGVVKEDAMYKSIEASIRSLTGISDPRKLATVKNSIARSLANLKPALKAIENVQYTGNGKTTSNQAQIMPAINTGRDRWLKV